MEELDLSKDLLPVGTIVNIRFSTTKYMILGYFTIDGNSGKRYDYSAVSFPQGLVDLDDAVAFDRSYVKSVARMGYISDEYKEYTKDLLEEVRLLDEEGYKPDLSNLNKEEAAPETNTTSEATISATVAVTPNIKSTVKEEAKVTELPKVETGTKTIIKLDE